VHVESISSQIFLHVPWFSARYYCNARCTGKHANYIFMQPITLDSPHKKINWILNKNLTASEQNDVLFLENKGTNSPPTYQSYLIITLSHKRLSEKKDDHHGEAVRQVQRHG